MAGLSLRLARVLSPLTSLGPGRRVGIWVQGCTLACEGCASRDTWDPDAGTRRDTQELAAELLDLLDADLTLTGLTITGGEPAQQGEALAELVRLVSEAADRPIDVLVFTGYPLPVARERAPALLARADAVIAGRYRPSAGYGGPLLGSANQQRVLLTDLAQWRWAMYDARPQLQVTVAGDSLVLAGIPAPGDLDRLRSKLEEAGVHLGSVSWQP